jgi:hypothetical protein
VCVSHVAVTGAHVRTTFMVTFPTFRRPFIYSSRERFELEQYNYSCDSILILYLYEIKSAHYFKVKLKGHSSRNADDSMFMLLACHLLQGNSVATKNKTDRSQSSQLVYA